ncbi:MAG: hypothetical protein AAF684_09515 [Pseudomonadota bacterium]
MRLVLAAASIALATLSVPTSQAGEAVVVDARASWVGPNRARIDVTIRHADEGWDHYADQWTVETTGGEVLGTRTLLHPHVNEQPFTRSLTVDIPAGLSAVAIRARDSVHGENPATFRLALPAR